MKEPGGALLVTEGQPMRRVSDSGGRSPNIVGKLPYTAPELTCYGSLEDLTQDAGNLGNDGLAGSKAQI